MEQENKLSFLQFLNTLRWLFAYQMRLSPTVTILKTITTTLSTLEPLVYAYIFAKLLDNIISLAKSSTNPNDIIPTLGIMLAYYLFASAVNYTDNYLNSSISYLNNYKSPQFLYRHIHSLGIQTLETPEVANKIQRSRETLGNIGGAFNSTVLFLAKIITLITAGTVIVSIMPFFMIVIFVTMIPGIFSNGYYTRQDWKIYRKETENKRRAQFSFNILIETSNLQEITITSAYDYLNNVYRKFADRFMAAELNNMKRWQFFGFLFGSLTSATSIVGYFLILKDFFYGLISVGVTTFQIRSLDIFISNLNSVGSRYIGLQENCLRINEIKQVFDLKPMVIDGTHELPSQHIAPPIKFDNVSFKYPRAEKYAIKNLNLEIKPGEKIAIVGENGAGKTTLVRILSRFYKINEGEILLDDKNINDIKIDSWYKNLGVLFQDYNTYSPLTLKENIHLGNAHEKLDEERMMTAANRANVNSFISNFKNGYDQVLSEKFKGGTRPSTGQWQKIAIARFFYRNSPVVIFDEPTASIDAVSEAEIFGQIYEFFKDKTVIIISHRFSTVRNADKIYVLDEGKIAESGNHDELMKLKGKYHNAFTIQAEGYK